jgi:hypothetical protein
VAAGGLHSAAEERLATAEDLTRLAARPADACPLPRDICPEHGATLRLSVGRCECTALG